MRSNPCAVACCIAMASGCSAESTTNDAPARQDACWRSGECPSIGLAEPSDGLQVRFGPDDYDDPDLVEPFVLEPGEERVDCQYRQFENEANVHYDRYEAVARPGMHHLLVHVVTQSVTHGHLDRCEAREADARFLELLQGGIDGLEYAHPQDPIAEENRGLAKTIPARATFAAELHSINTTDAPLLREAWMNFRFIPLESVTGIAGLIQFNGGLDMAIPPKSQQIVTNSCPVPMDTPVRVVDLFGHVHSHGVRVSAWAVRGDNAVRSLIYETYDWTEIDLIQYDSVTENPEPDLARAKSGGYSGILTLEPGDRLDYECEIHNTEDFVLRYAARTYDAEMCSMFGTFTPGGPTGVWRCNGD